MLCKAVPATANVLELRDSVRRVLQLLFDDKVDVPFIWHFRRDSLHDALKPAHLWRILDLDFEWVEMYSRTA